MREFIFTSSILILAVALLRLILGRRIPARVRYALWAVVLLRLAVPISPVQSGLSAANLLHAPALSAPAPAAPNAPAAPTLSGDAAGQNPGGIPAAPRAPAAPGQAVLYWGWGLGSLAVGGWMLAGNLRFARQLKTGRRPLPRPAQGGPNPAEGCPLPVWQCSGLASPCLFGALRPAIYLNDAACGSPDAQGWAVRHEWQHHRHGDHLWCLARCICLAVYWWHPLVWLAAALSKRDCELACDEGVTASLDEDARLSYGRCLLALAPERGTVGCPRPLAATSMSESARQLRDRLAAITQGRRPAVWAAAAAAAAALVLGMTTLTGASGETGHSSRDAAAALDQLQNSIAVRDGMLGFTLPETGFGPDEWSIHISGSARMGDGQMSLHFLEQEPGWQGGSWYPVTSEAELYNGITELWLDAALPDEEGEQSVTVDLLETALELESRRIRVLAAALPQEEDVWLDFPLGEDGTLVYSFLKENGPPKDEDAVNGHVYLVREGKGIEQVDPLVETGGRLVDELAEGAGYFCWWPVWVNEGQRVLFGWQTTTGTALSTRLWTLENGALRELDCPAEQLVYSEGNDFTGIRSAWDAIEDEDGATGHTHKLYWLYWDEAHGALREYPARGITEAELLAMDGGEGLAGKLLAEIRAEGGVLGSIYLRENGIINLNYAIPLGEDGTAHANHNATLARSGSGLTLVGFGDQGPGGLNSELLRVTDQGGVYEAVGWRELAGV